MWNGERTTCPLPLQGKSGALLPVETRVWFGQWNGEDCIFGICKDLSAEQEALQKFERLFRHNPAPMAVTDLPDRRFTDVNDAWLKTAGYSLEEVLGRTTMDLDLFPDPEQQRAAAEDLQVHGRFADVELKVRRRDGTILDGLFSGEIVESQGRQHFLTVMIDQTERKRAEARLRASERRYRDLVENSHDIIYTLTPGGVFTFVSPGWTALLGHPTDEVVGRAFEPFVHPDDVEGCRAFLQAVIETGERRVGIEYRVRHVDGSWRWHSSNGAPVLDETGTVIGYEGNAADITERRLATEALRALQAELAGLPRSAGRPREIDP